MCRGQAGPQSGRSLRVCPANPRGLTLGNRRLLQKYQPVAPTQIQLSSSLALVPINSFSLQAHRKRNACTSPAYKLSHTKAARVPSWLLQGVPASQRSFPPLQSPVCGLWPEPALLSTWPMLIPEQADPHLVYDAAISPLQQGSQVFAEKMG